MLNKKNRISNRRLIQKLLNKGRLYRNVHFIFKYLPSTEDSSQFAIVISKKVASKAVDRNKLKRQISESLRENIKLIKTHIVSLVIVKPGAIEKGIDYKAISKGLLDFINNYQDHE